MNKILTIFFINCCVYTASAQEIDSIFFNLYTDSLKKGAWNYINIDAKLSNGKFIPLTKTQLIITTTGGKLDGNSIWLDWDFLPAFITVEIKLKDRPLVTKKQNIWVKKQDLQMNAPVNDSLLQQINNRNKKVAPPKRKKN